MKISIDPLPDQKLKNLIDILLEEGYFAVEANAFNYVQGIYDFIDTIPRQVPGKLKNAGGDYCCQYKPNRQTTWYIIFDIENDYYLIRDIIELL